MYTQIHTCIHEHLHTQWHAVKVLHMNESSTRRKYQMRGGCMKTGTKTFRGDWNATEAYAFVVSGLDLDGPVVASCGTGVTACVLVLVSTGMDAWMCMRNMDEEVIFWSAWVFMSFLGIIIAGMVGVERSAYSFCGCGCGNVLCWIERPTCRCGEKTNGDLKDVFISCHVLLCCRRFISLARRMFPCTMDHGPNGPYLQTLLQRLRSQNRSFPMCESTSHLDSYFCLWLILVWG